jgi:CelD/BcsL family acetyltransferase involved in cellulose biosynthesis
LLKAEPQIMTDLALLGPAHRNFAWTAPRREDATGRALQGQVLRGPEAYQTLRPDWLRLAKLQHGANIFQAPDLLDCWSRHFATDTPEALATIVVRGQDGRAVLIWPLVVERKGLVRVARGAGSPFGQYDEIVLDPDCDAAEAFAIAGEVLMRKARPDLVVLERVRADGALHGVIGAVAPLSGEGAPYSNLSQGSAKLMAGLKSRVLSQQKKRVRRFEQEGVVGFEIAADPAQAAAWLAEAMEIKREWLRSTGRFSRAFLKSATADCLADCARTLARPEASPRMIVSRLTLDGRTAAIEMGFCHRGTYHLYLGAFSDALGKFGPGNILTEKLLHWCADNGIDRYDMLAPRSRNKSEWQSDEVEVFNFALPTTWRGRLYVEMILRRLLPGLRKAFYGLPDGLRSTLAGFALRKLGKSDGEVG